MTSEKLEGGKTLETNTEDARHFGIMAQRNICLRND